MTWKQQLDKYEQNQDWDGAVALMQKVVNGDPSDLTAAIAFNYLVMNILVEEDYDMSKHDYFAGLLKENFVRSYARFHHKAEFLFYTGITAHISEWYFDIEIAKAQEMIHQSHTLEPDNVLYKWGYWEYLDMSNPLNMEVSKKIAVQILSTASIIASLKDHGAIGKYILGIMQYSISEMEIQERGN